MGRRMQKMNNFHLGSQPQRMWRTMTRMKERGPCVDELPASRSVPPVLTQRRTLQQQLSLSPQGSRWRGGAFQHCPQPPFSGCFQLTVPACVSVCVCMCVCVPMCLHSCMRWHFSRGAFHSCLFSSGSKRCTSLLKVCWWNKETVLRGGILITMMIMILMTASNH